MEYNSAYENLANAIVIQAARDYRDALKRLSHGRVNQDAESVKRECERFFRSEWYELLTKLDSEVLMKKLQQEV